MSWFSRRELSGLYIAPFVRVARLSDDGSVGVGVSGGAWLAGVARHPAIDIRAGAGAQYIDYRVHDAGMNTPFIALDGVVGYRL